MTQKEFETKWHHKVVRPSKECIYQIPKKEYGVTACLWEFETDGTSIFAIMALDYSVENKHWFTFKLGPDEVAALDKNFEIVS